MVDPDTDALAGLAAPARAPERHPVPRRRRRPVVTRVVLGAVVPVTLVALWQALGSIGALRTFVPTPFEVAVAFAAFLDPTATGPALPGTVGFAGQGLAHVGASVQLLLSAYVVAVAIGVPAGAALALSPLFRSLTDPMVQGLRAIPIFAWLPLAIVWFGLGPAPARFLVVVGAVFPILVATADAVARVPRAWVETARMLGTPRRQLLRRVYLPAALPGIVVGCRLGVSLGWMSVIVGEFVSTSTLGIGVMMDSARMTGRLDQVVVGMVCFAVLGLLSDTVLRVASARWTRWART
ncbi:ABC transporter permease [Aquipuribacter nitratireducens]|uniref:ABC transporter permease n=1 Tax=Aquipuribacter nitratireducens TaxID=650104 RepID=A0ABW0GMX9_9MICO